MAHWIIDDKGFGGCYYKCSKCGDSWLDLISNRDKEQCTCCWAIMDEETEEHVSEFVGKRQLIKPFDDSIGSYSDTINAAINILAVELLIKTYDMDTYIHYCNILDKLNDDERTWLWVLLSLNMHIKNLGEMITQDDYECQKYRLFDFLDRVERGEELYE